MCSCSCHEHGVRGERVNGRGSARLRRALRCGEAELELALVHKRPRAVVGAARLHLLELLLLLAYRRRGRLELAQVVDLALELLDLLLLPLVRPAPTQAQAHAHRELWVEVQVHAHAHRELWEDASARARTPPRAMGGGGWRASTGDGRR
eukprot:4227186-Prymnesium_polylepis.1